MSSFEQTKLYSQYRKRKYNERGGRYPTKQEINKAKKDGYVLADDGKTQFTIKAYHGCRRSCMGKVYQVAVEFADKYVCWVDKEKLLPHASESLNDYFNKLNKPNPLNKNNIKLK